MYMCVCVPCMYIYNHIYVYMCVCVWENVCTKDSVSKLMVGLSGGWDSRAAPRNRIKQGLVYAESRCSGCGTPSEKPMDMRCSL